MKFISTGIQPPRNDNPPADLPESIAIVALTVTATCWRLCSISVLISPTRLSSGFNSDLLTFYLHRVNHRLDKGDLILGQAEHIRSCMSAHFHVTLSRYFRVNKFPFLFAKAPPLQQHLVGILTIVFPKIRHKAEVLFRNVLRHYSLQQ